MGTPSPAWLSPSPGVAYTASFKGVEEIVRSSDGRSVVVLQLHDIILHG